MATWNPDLYLKFKNERTQPSSDLVARIENLAPSSILDLGCGPGNSTQVLRTRWPDAHITGLDSSTQMIAKAKSDYPDNHWLVADAVRWKPEKPFDLVYSNAVLQWIPDHQSLPPSLSGWVAPKGALAVQIPANYDCPLYQAVLSVSAKQPWSQTMAGLEKRLHYHDASFYYPLLSALFPRVFLWYTTYYHVMDSHQALLEWYAGSALKPYLDSLSSDDARQQFTAEILATCKSDYPVEKDGKVLFPFKRLFFLVYKD